jgi:TatD DNase family protein
MIDTHCHLYTKEFKNDIDIVIQNAITAGVTRCFLPAIDKDSIDSMITLSKSYPDNCFLMAGLHPCSVKENYMEEIEAVKNVMQEYKVYGIGETGLDFYWDKTYVQQQYQALDIQIQLALEHDLPLILHTRDALQATIEIIKKYKHTALRGIFHCFGGSLEQAKEIIKTGFYMGIGGIVTYKNAGVAEVLKQVDMQHLVLETDAPYLTPVPFRGKRNESSYLKYIVEKIAEVKNVSVEEVEYITTTNAEKIFGV